MVVAYTFSSPYIDIQLSAGAGRIQQDIYQSADYYVAVGNLNTEEVKVKYPVYFSRAK